MDASSRKAPKVAAAAALVCLALAGCASFPSNIAPGMSRAEVLDRFGRPAVDRPDSRGEVMIYSTAPMGQLAFAAQLDGAGKVVSVDQVLTTQNFARIKKGEWDEDTVLGNFGPPAQRESIRGNPVWDYRYKEFNVYDSMFSITFDENGRVLKTENGPDPLKDGGRGHDGGRK